MNIKLTLITSVILEAVKAETSVKGRIDHATNPQATEIAFQETAGDEVLHERKLMRGIYTSLDKLKVLISDFLETSGYDTADNSIKSSVNNDDTITITISVSDRFNTSLSDSLARLCSKYIEDSTLVLWWGALGNAAQTQFYQGMLTEDAMAITRIFTKKSPRGVKIPYTSSIVIEGSEVIMEVGDTETLSYAIDEGVIDDIAWDKRGDAVVISRKDGHITATAKHPGISHVRLFSIHDETIEDSLDFIVRSLDGTIPDSQHRKHI